MQSFLPLRYFITYTISQSLSTKQTHFIFDKKLFQVILLISSHLVLKGELKVQRELISEFLSLTSPELNSYTMPPKRKQNTEISSDTKNIAKKVKNVKVPAVLKKPKKSIKVSSKTINYSLCVPTSVLDNCTNLDQITNVVYQISKSATIFNVGEIVILNLGDGRRKNSSNKSEEKEDKNVNDKKDKKRLSDSILLASLLQYFVTPPYLVNTVFKKEYQQYFKYAVQLPRLSALPFMRYTSEDKGRYREGLSIRMTKPGSENSNSNSKEKKNKNKEFKQTKYINIGKGHALELKTQLVPVNVRVTVDTIDNKVVSPLEAYGDFVGAQSSYGYHVRVAQTFGNLFTECSFKDGYSQAIWVNSGDFYYNENLKKYSNIENKLGRIKKIVRTEPKETETTNTMSNLLIVFGKWDHMKGSFDDSKDQFEGCAGAHEFFDGQLELPGTSPSGAIPIQDSCLISLTLLSTL